MAYIPSLRPTNSLIARAAAWSSDHATYILYYTCGEHHNCVGPHAHNILKLILREYRHTGHFELTLPAIVQPIVSSYLHKDAPKFCYAATFSSLWIKIFTWNSYIVSVAKCILKRWGFFTFFHSIQDVRMEADKLTKILHPVLNGSPHFFRMCFTTDICEFH